MIFVITLFLLIIDINIKKIYYKFIVVGKGDIIYENWNC